MVQVNFNTTPRYNTVIFLTFVTGKMMLMSNLWSDRASDKETILKFAFLQVLQPGDHVSTFYHSKVAKVSCPQKKYRKQCLLRGF